MKTPETETPRNLGDRIKRSSWLSALIPIALCGAIYYVTRSAYWIFFGILSSVSLVYLSYQNKVKAQTEKQRQRDNEFVTMIAVFRILIGNRRDIYNAFRETAIYVSPWMKHQLAAFLNEIDGNKTIEPYIRFAENFTPLIVRQVMTSIYQMVDAGTEHDLDRFSVLFDRFAEQRMALETAREETRFDAFNFYPLIGAAVLAVGLIVGVISIVGGVINEL